MEYNKFQQKVNEIFNKNINEGIIIKAPRQIGKTLFILLKANELAKKGQKIKIISHSLDASDYLKKSAYRARLNHKNILFVSYSYKPTLGLKLFEEDYTFYDESWLYNKIISLKGNDLHIGTSNEREFIFDNSWSELNKKDLERKKKEIGEDVFRKEFNSNIVKKC